MVQPEQPGLVVPARGGRSPAGAYTAMNADWDGIVRRGVFIYPAGLGRGAGRNHRRRRHLSDRRGDQRQPAYLRPLAARGFALSTGPHRAGRAAPPRRRDRRQAKGRAGDSRADGIPPAAGCSSTRPSLRAQPVGFGGETASFPQLELSTENPFAVLVCDLAQHRADRIDQAAACFGDRPGRADRFSLGQRLETRGRRPRPAPLSARAGDRHGHLAAQGTSAGIRAQQRGRSDRAGDARGLAAAARASSCRSTARRPLSTGN